MTDRPSIAVLVPYCPWPTVSGARIEMVKHLAILRDIGEVTILSAHRKPVGGGWSDDQRVHARDEGYRLLLREDDTSVSWHGMLGTAYAALCKGLRLERAFGHANPYHRFAFPAAWWQRHTRDADLVVINYSYWAHLPTHCPKAVVLHDLWSATMWGGDRRELAELKACDLIQVISVDEKAHFAARGVAHTVWSPPLAPPLEAPCTEQIALIGSANAMNREGLRWLCRALPAEPPTVRVYGGLSDHAPSPPFERLGAYSDPTRPHRECGTLLVPTALGTGVQIKVVEALAAGRAIVARRGAMRGIPPSDSAWHTVDTPEQMWSEAENLADHVAAREALAARARAYYAEHLEASAVRERTAAAYRACLGTA